jgi:predicted DNA-binding protein
MVIGLRMEPELERQLDRLTQQQGKPRSACNCRMPGWSPRP